MDIKCSIFSKFPPNILVVKMNYELATPSAAFIYHGVRNPHCGRTSVVGKLLLSTLQGTLHRCLRKSSHRESGFLSHWLNCLLAWSRARGAVFPAAALFLTRTDTSGGALYYFLKSQNEEESPNILCANSWSWSFSDRGEIVMNGKFSARVDHWDDQIEIGSCVSYLMAG